MKQDFVNTTNESDLGPDGDVAHDLDAGDRSSSNTALRQSAVGGGAGTKQDAGILSGTNPPGKSETPLSGGALDGGDLAQGTGAGSAGGTADLAARSDEQKRDDRDTSRH